MKFKVVLTVLIVGFIGLVVYTSDGTSRSRATEAGTTFDSLIGKPAPDFTLSSYDGKSYTLSQLKGKKVLLFFNEGLMCYPACWNQVAALGIDEKLNNGDNITLSIVPDARDGWSEAIAKMPELGKEAILLDTDRSVSRSYGTLYLPSSMHKGSMPGHTYVLIDESGIVRYTYDDPKMGLRNTELIEEIDNI